MAKRARRVLRARKEERHDDSLLIRSAESLGRVIGSLQRQMQGSSKRVSSPAGARATGARKSKKAARTGGTRASSAARKPSGSRKRAGSKPSKKR